ncbi:uncharacterized protein (DUF1800 family) [Litoreibacter ponti]|uniref:Uncharacterized protein (DUF1800 family) n=1 Tax=Litoreibacter ponti TaxID=1510457 RepID=A0A2T6BLV0_9RHOB|nr:DUF1800 domain-containing protein [Litoreibacter ponti]PTX57053.1 uncharacterized protein (DUF1800 family) [Litoreibacter ponti]
MAFSPDIAAIRFGEGLAPAIAPPDSVAALLGQLDGADAMAELLPVPRASDLLPEMAEIRKLNKAARKGRNGPDADDLREAYKVAQRAYTRKLDALLAPVLGRSILSQQPFRERLARFWGDHFTVVGKNNLTRRAEPTYVEESIRPHIAGRFEDMLKAVVTSPMMLDYLDQNGSVGPNAKAAKGRKGLNENLAREMLELHTLGVGGAYTQGDVHELAQLLTGMGTDLQQGFVFRAKAAEPGAETVLGLSYGGGPASVEHVLQFLSDVARHPDTARHIARKLAVHFLSDTPDAALVAAMADTFLVTDGDLRAVYAVMLEHPFAWQSFGQKVKQPIDFVASALRALEVPVRSLAQLNRSRARGYLVAPMMGMGQHWLRPGGPDGWPEEAEAWITPQGLAARIQWSMAVPSSFFRSLPDPRDFVEVALGSVADEKVSFAARAAETRREGVGLILASPAFQRR